jgi:serine/threonine protein kinase
VRRVYLDVANAGIDDGVPASILREVSLLKSLDHPHIIRLIDVFVEGPRITLLQEHMDLNLKDFIKRRMVPLNNSQAKLKFGCEQAHTLPLPEI